MSTPADLHRAVQTTLASKRLGTPVFVRYLYHHNGNAAGVLAQLTRTVTLVRDWLGQPIERVYALGSFKERHITVTLEGRGGATALITWAGTAGSGIDLTVVGNHGALYHDVGMANAWDAPEFANEPPPDKELLALIENALRTGRPEKGGKP